MQFFLVLLDIFPASQPVATPVEGRRLMESIKQSYNVPLVVALTTFRNQFL